MITRKKRNFIIITIIMIIIIIVALTCILYAKTDFLKPNNFLFTKYIAQNFDVVEDMINTEEEKNYSNTLKQSNYEYSSKISAQYIENYNTDSQKKDNLINDLNITVDGKINNTENIKYADVKINDIYNNNEILNLEYINQNNQMYSVKFVNILKQYISIQNTNLKEFAQKIGIDSKNIPNQIAELNINELLKFTDEEIEILKNTYGNLIIGNISQDKFTKQKDAIITVNENSINTNAYILKLTKEELNNIYIKVLETLKQDQIILNKIQQIENQIVQYINNEEYNEKIKQTFIENIDIEIKNIQDNNIGQNEIRITVYENNGKTVRTLIESEDTHTKIDLQNNEDNKNINIQKNMNSEEENTQTLKLSKTGTLNSLNLIIDYEEISNDNTIGFEYNRGIMIDNTNLSEDTKFNYNNGKDEFSIEYSKQNNILNDGLIEIPQIDENNNVILNNYGEEELNVLLSTIIEQVTNSLKEKMQNIEERFYNSIPNVNMDIELENTDETAEIEKNRFNAKFSFYESEETTYAKAEELLNIIAEHLGSMEVLSGTEIKLNIEKGKEDKETVEKILQVMNENKKYKIQINYDETNLISNVIITILNDN